MRMGFFISRENSKNSNCLALGKIKFQDARNPPEIPLNPPFSKGETILLPLLKGGGEGFLVWLNNFKK
jgi:hypothetical protein